MDTQEARRQERALKLADQLANLSHDEGLTRRVMQIRARLSVPMASVLEQVPGRSISSKARFLGVSRPSYYDWLRGISRPGAKMAKKLSRVTGFSVAEIRGLSDAP